MWFEVVYFSYFEALPSLYLFSELRSNIFIQIKLAIWHVKFASLSFAIRAQQRHEDGEKVCFQVLNHTDLAYLGKNRATVKIFWVAYKK